MRVIYLASPYTHEDKEVRQYRFEEMCRVHADLLHLHGKTCAFIGPIAMTHSIAEYAKLPTIWDFWKVHDEAILSKCDELWVIMMDGWTESVGVTAEIAYAYAHNIPVIYVRNETKPIRFVGREKFDSSLEKVQTKHAKNIQALGDE